MRPVKRLRAVAKRPNRGASGGRFEFYCDGCGDRSPMYTLNGAALAYRCSWRSIIRLIEAGTVHTAEPETSEMFVCGRSLADALSKASASPDPGAQEK